MSERYLKTEEQIIIDHYPTASKDELMRHLPGRAWTAIYAHAQILGVQRTRETKGKNIVDGLKKNRINPNFFYSDEEVARLIEIYPSATRAELSAAFPNRSMKALTACAYRLGLKRTREAKGIQMGIGRAENARN